MKSFNIPTKLLFVIAKCLIWWPRIGIVKVFLLFSKHIISFSGNVLYKISKPLDSMVTDATFWLMNIDTTAHWHTLSFISSTLKLFGVKEDNLPSVDDVFPGLMKEIKEGSEFLLGKISEFFSPQEGINLAEYEQSKEINSMVEKTKEIIGLNT